MQTVYFMGDNMGGNMRVSVLMLILLALFSATLTPASASNATLVDGWNATCANMSMNPCCNSTFYLENYANCSAALNGTNNAPMNSTNNATSSTPPPPQRTLPVGWNATCGVSVMNESTNGSMNGSMNPSSNSSCLDDCMANCTSSNATANCTTWCASNCNGTSHNNSQSTMSPGTSPNPCCNSTYYLSHIECSNMPPPSTPPASPPPPPPTKKQDTVNTLPETINADGTVSIVIAPNTDVIVTAPVTIPDKATFTIPQSSTVSMPSLTLPAGSTLAISLTSKDAAPIAFTGNGSVTLSGNVNVTFTGSVLADGEKILFCTLDKKTTVRNQLRAVDLYFVVLAARDVSSTKGETRAASTTTKKSGHVVCDTDRCNIIVGARPRPPPKSKSLTKTDKMVIGIVVGVACGLLLIIIIAAVIISRREPSPNRNQAAAPVRSTAAPVKSSANTNASRSVGAKPVSRNNVRMNAASEASSDEYYAAVYESEAATDDEYETES